MSRDDRRLDPLPLSPSRVLERELAIDRRVRRPLSDFNATQPGVVNPLTGAAAAGSAPPRPSRLAIEPNEPVRQEPRVSMAPHTRQGTTDRVAAVARPQVTAPPPPAAPAWTTDSTAVVKGPPTAPAVPQWRSDATAVTQGPPSAPPPMSEATAVVKGPPSAGVPAWAASTAVISPAPPAAAAPTPAWAASTAVISRPPAAPEPDPSRAPTSLAIPVVQRPPPGPDLRGVTPLPQAAPMPTIRPQALGPAVLPGHQQRPLTPTAIKAPLGESAPPPTAAASPRAMPSPQLKRPTTPAPIAPGWEPLPSGPGADQHEPSAITQQTAPPPPAAPSSRPPLGEGFAVTQPGVAGPFARKPTQQTEAQRPTAERPALESESEPEPESTPPPGHDFAASVEDDLQDAIDSEVRKLPTEVRRSLTLDGEPAPRTGEVESLEVIARPASLWRRVGAIVVDLAVFLLLLGGATAALLTVKGPKVHWTGGAARLLPMVLDGLKPLGLVLAATTVALVFAWVLTFSWAFNARSPGRKLFGLHLVDGRGHSPSLVRAMARAVFCLPSLGLALAGFWLSLFDRRGQTLHDKLSSTFVVRLTTEDS